MHRGHSPRRCNKSDPFLALHPAHAQELIFYRDFPKRHGNLINAALCIALKSHPGGLSLIESRFSFLSGCDVSVDNFFVDQTGKIRLF